MKEREEREHKRTIQRKLEKKLTTAKRLKIMGILSGRLVVMYIWF